jgi:hypothetical protein
MTLFTEQQYQKLIENGRNRDQDHAPVVRLHILFTGCQWLISELDPETPNIAFGLCDLGMGSPELGYVDLEEVKAIKNVPFSVMRDVFFEGTYPMSVYCCAARIDSHITTEEHQLKQCSNKLKKPKLQP